MNDTPVPDLESLVTGCAEPDAGEFIDTRTDPEGAQLAFIRRRMPTVVALSAQVHDEDYQIPDGDRATLARVADDLMYAVERAEVWRSAFANLWDRMHALDAVNVDDLEPEVAEVLRHFQFAHLPEHLAGTSKLFAVLAHRLVLDLPASAELVAGLRKLLESKDCAVRCAVVDNGERPEIEGAA